MNKVVQHEINNNSSDYTVNVDEEYQLFDLREDSFVALYRSIVLKDENAQFKIKNKRKTFDILND